MKYPSTSVKEIEKSKEKSIDASLLMHPLVKQIGFSHRWIFLTKSNFGHATSGFVFVIVCVVSLTKFAVRSVSIKQRLHENVASIFTSS